MLLCEGGELSVIRDLPIVGSIPSDGREGSRPCILASSANQDGRSAALTAPNGPAQERVVRLALTGGSRQLAPADVASVQLHGTGTALGDPIEVGALVSALLADEAPSTVGSSSCASNPRLPLALEASKSVAGHCEAASGAVGIAHALASLRSGRQMAVCHLANLNAHVAATLAAGGSSTRAVGMARQSQPSMSFHRTRSIGRGAAADRKKSDRDEPTGWDPASQSDAFLFGNDQSDDQSDFFDQLDGNGGSGKNGSGHSMAIGVSSFAFQGTNAHCVVALENAPAGGRGSLGGSFGESPWEWTKSTEVPRTSMEVTWRSAAWVPLRTAHEYADGSPLGAQVDNVP